MEIENKNSEEISELLKHNADLIAENNKLLKKIHRNAVWSFWTRVIWYVIIIGLPFALYFYILEPYFTALGSSYKTFSAGIQEIPGLKIIMDILQGAHTQ